MKKCFSCLLCLFIYFSSINLAVFGECGTIMHESQTLSQSELTPLDILILDLQEVKGLIEEGNNKLAITILKSANKEVRKVEEFDSETKKITQKRIKKGIAFLKQGKNDEALELVQLGIDTLIDAGLADPSDFE